MARVQEPFSQDLPGAELSEGGVLQKKHLGMRRHTLHPVFLNVREIPEAQPESSSLLPSCVGFITSTCSLQTSVWTRLQPVSVLPGWTSLKPCPALEKACGCSFLLWFSVAVWTKENFQRIAVGAGMTLVTPALVWNVPNSVEYTDRYDVDASLCRGSRHLKQDD